MITPHFACVKGFRRVSGVEKTRSQKSGEAGALPGSKSAWFHSTDGRPSRSDRRHSCGGPTGLEPRFPTALTPTVREGRGEEGKTEGERCRKVRARCVVGPGMGLVAGDGEGLGVIQVSSGVADDGLTVPGKMGGCPGPRPPAGGRPLRR
jgi:hypothetical protein